MMFRTRFAPSPTGPLHLGHAYSALLAHDMARKAGGAFLLRIEDIDRERSKPEWTAAILADLDWLGIRIDGPIIHQSANATAYHAAIAQLWSMGLLYPCRCTRRDIAQALSAPQEGASPPIGPDGPIYPGTCRAAPREGPPPRNSHLRLDMAMALDMLGPATPTFTETGPTHAGQIATTPAFYAAQIGDIVIARRDMGTSYHLSVTIDDAAQAITHVIRGEDLFAATRIHVLLQRLLALPTPTYHHHSLIRDETGKRLAKRDDARAIRLYRSDGATPDDIRRSLGL
jgi:glutamyl-Q tRNA(Asp) synthetase